MTERAAADLAKVLLARLIADYERRVRPLPDVDGFNFRAYGGCGYGNLMQAKRLLRDWPERKS